jgi:hypothetical protein
MFSARTPHTQPEVNKLPLGAGQARRLLALNQESLRYHCLHTTAAGQWWTFGGTQCRLQTPTGDA